MLQEYNIITKNLSSICKKILSDWLDCNTKVFVTRAVESIENTRAFYESLFPMLGTPVPLAEDVRAGDRSHQRTGDIWMEVRYDPKFPNAYRHSAEAQPLHTDGSYIPSFPSSTLLCCVSNSAIGGETIFIDSKDVFYALETEQPELLSQLMNNSVPHARSGDSRDLPIIYQKNGMLYVNWNYYCVSPDANDVIKNMANQFHHYLLHSPIIKAKTIGVKLNPGDAVLWKDHEVLHGRNAFSPTKESERFIWKCAFDVGVFA